MAGEELRGSLAVPPANRKGIKCFPKSSALGLGFSSIIPLGLQKTM